MKTIKTKRRKKIRLKLKKTIRGSSIMPRLSVFRSNKNIYAQIIDDVKGNTLTSASSKSKDFDKFDTKILSALEVGKLIAKKASKKGISIVKFDRGGYLYHGRVKSLADGAREGGLKF
ncbi:MAG: 50S ribosomal protein L18 [Flavobacteriaceae bacterium]|tara:strand:- start:5833 stop:6186 length:354 start_codon:yes stop_codon:yes gene_type:complete